MSVERSYEVGHLSRDGLGCMSCSRGPIFISRFRSGFGGGVQEYFRGEPGGEDRLVTRGIPALRAQEAWLLNSAPSPLAMITKERKGTSWDVTDRERSESVPFLIWRGNASRVHGRAGS